MTSAYHTILAKYYSTENILNDVLRRLNFIEESSNSRRNAEDSISNSIVMSDFGNNEGQTSSLSTSSRPPTRFEGGEASSICVEALNMKSEKSIGLENDSYSQLSAIVDYHQEEISTTLENSNTHFQSVEENNVPTTVGMSNTEEGPFIPLSITSPTTNIELSATSSPDDSTRSEGENEFEEPEPVILTRPSRFLTVKSIPNNRLPDARDRVIESILAYFTPQELQITYRNSARAFLSQLVRQSLKAKIFEAGLPALHCFLPDDPFRLCILLWRGNSVNWLSILNDSMQAVSLTSQTPTNSNTSGGVSNKPFVGGDGLTSAEEEGTSDMHTGGSYDGEVPTGNHILTHLNPSSSAGHNRMCCNIDSIPVEISPNSRADICFLAFIEDVAILIGKNNLFKRSLLLIRAWWTYESSAYLGVPTKSFLPDVVLCVMVCCIFNNHYRSIVHPLQALAIFLAEFSDLKWTECAVTIHGISPFRVHGPDSNNQPQMAEFKPTDLFNLEFCQKHVEFYHMQSNDSVPTNTPPADPPLPIEGQGGEEAPGGGVVSDSTNTGVLDESVSISTPGAIIAPENSVVPTQVNTQVAVKNFQRRLMNIVHPLTYANMISASMSAERSTKIATIFETGAKELQTALDSFNTSLPAEESDINRPNPILNGVNRSPNTLEKFFKGVVLRFSGGWRPDVFSNSVLIGNEESSTIPR